MRSFAAFLALSALACSCAKRGPAPGESSDAAASASAAPALPSATGASAPDAAGLDGAPARSLSDAAPGDASGALASASGDGGPTACPGGMVLVDGDYCTELELRCEKSWYAKWNDKTVCERFDEPSKCTGKKVHKRYCIDQYEFPNQKGERPRVMFDFFQAQHLCAAEGKRVCTETEWTMACEGPSYEPYPYGYVRDPTICNGDQRGVEPAVTGHDQKGAPFLAFASKDPAVSGPELERLWQGVVSGSQPKCVSDYGVWDMPGNADELASSETPEPVSKFDNVTTGGPWRYGVRNQCRPKIYTHNEGFAYYYLSTRCCAEPDGQPTDPRSPKQIKRGEKWKP